jgi:Phage integrase family
LFRYFNVAIADPDKAVAATREKAGDALVFCEPDGAPIRPSNLSYTWRNTCISQDLPKVTFHALRHTHASALIAAGVDVVTISKRLGHSSPVVTTANLSPISSTRTTVLQQLDRSGNENAGATGATVIGPFRCQFSISRRAGIC